MLEIKISDIDSAARIAKTWATHVISLFDTDFNAEEYFLPLPNYNSSYQLKRYYFDDVLLQDNSFNSKNLKPATLEQIQEILQFTQSLIYQHKLLIHCNGGISRSPAIACGILCQHGLSPQRAIDKILEIRDIASPNSYIIQLLDNKLNLNNQLITEIKSRHFLFS
jgi:predicted protein tyrosine phosphatase